MTNINRLLSWLSINYMKGQINHSLHLEFVCMQATDEHMFYVLICMWYFVKMSEFFALYKSNVIVVIISKYLALFLMADFIRQPLTKVLEIIKQSSNIHSNDVW